MPTPEEIYHRSLDKNNTNTTLTKHMVHPVTPPEAIPPKKQSWDDIWVIFMESEECANCSQEELFMAYAKWLEANYKAPVRK